MVLLSGHRVTEGTRRLVIARAGPGRKCAGHWGTREHGTVLDMRWDNCMPSKVSRSLGRKGRPSKWEVGEPRLVAITSFQKGGWKQASDNEKLRYASDVGDRDCFVSKLMVATV